jgi:capsule polysaccharide export protein KpsE/RkpR
MGVSLNYVKIQAAMAAVGWRYRAGQEVPRISELKAMANSMRRALSEDSNYVECGGFRAFWHVDEETGTRTAKVMFILEMEI